MLSEALAALASAGGAAVMGAMVTDGWVAARRGFARLLGRDDPYQVTLIEENLERDRAALAGLRGGEMERLRAARTAVWRGRLADLLETSPEAEPELRDWLDLARTGAVGAITQQVTGHDNARQVTLGSGVQHITFDSRPGGPRTGD